MMMKKYLLVVLISFCVDTQASSTLGLPKKFDHRVFPKEALYDPEAMDLTKRPRLPRIEWMLGESLEERKVRLDKWKEENPLSRDRVVEPHQNDDWARRRFDRDNISDRAKYPENHPYNLIKRNALWAAFGFGAFWIGFNYRGFKTFNTDHSRLLGVAKIFNTLTDCDKTKFLKSAATLDAYGKTIAIGAAIFFNLTAVSTTIDFLWHRFDQKWKGTGPFFFETDRTAPLKITLCGLAGLAAGYAADSYLKSKLS